MLTDLCIVGYVYTIYFVPMDISYHLFVSILLILHIICILELVYLYLILKVKP